MNGTVARLSLVAVSSLLVNGCGTAYVEPAGGAPVTFRNATPVHLLLMSFAGPTKCTDPQGIGGFAPAAEKTVRFQEGKVATFSAQILSASSTATGLTSTSCIHIGSFVPQPGASYTATITATSDRCFLSISKKNSIAQIEQERGYVQRKYITPLVASEGFCSSLSEDEKKTLQLP